MGRQLSCVKPKLRKGLWSPEEDEKLFNYITRFGVGCWSTVPKLAGLQRCGKSCRLRWINYLRPNLKRGMFSQQEEDLIISLHQALGNRWAQIAAQLPGRTDNEIKNFWNSYLKKKLMKQGIDPNTHKPLSQTETTEGTNNDNSNSTEKSSSSSLAAAAAAANLQQFKGLPTESTPAEMEQFHAINNASYNNYEGTGILTRDQFESKPIFNPLFGYDQLIQPGGADDPIGYNSNLLTQYQNHHHLEVMNHNFGFNSMPSLTNFGHGNVGEVDFSGNSGQRMSSYSVNDQGKENVSNMLISSFQMNNINNNNDNVVDQNAEFSWGTDKLESVFQSQFSGIKSEEIVKSSPWPEPQNSEAFSGCYSLMSLSEDLAGASMDGFQQI